MPIRLESSLAGRMRGMSLSSAQLLVLLVCLSAVPSAAAQPAAPAPQRVQLRWKVPQGTPVGYEYLTQQLVPGSNTLRLNIAVLRESRLTPQQRRGVYELQVPSEAALAAVLAAKPSGDLSAKVVLTRVTMPKKKKNPSKKDRELTQALEKQLGTVKLRANLTDWGFVTTDLKREERNLLAFMFELPAKPVAVGDVWTHSADLVKMGQGWEGESETLNRVELTALEKDPEGHTVAVIDFTLAERQEGRFADVRMKKPLPASMEMSFVGRGEFLVEQGRWKRLAGRMTMRGTGVMETDLEQQVTILPLEPIPPKVLAAE